MYFSLDIYKIKTYLFEANRGTMVQSVAVNKTGRGFDSYSMK